MDNRLDNLDQVLICGTCLGLYARRRGKPSQRCRCRRSPDDPTWRGYDFNEWVHLCECCLLELLPSGSRWSVWFCDECKSRAVGVNDELRFWLIPIGRHTVMAKVYGRSPGFLTVSGSVAARVGDPEADREVERFRTEMLSLFTRMAWLHEWASERLAANLIELGFREGRDVPILEYLRVAGGTSESGSRLHKETAFSDLSAFMLARLSGSN